MISMTPTLAPADLVGSGGFDVRPAYGPGLCSGSAELVAVHIAAPTPPVQGSGLPAGTTAVRLRRVTWQAICPVVVATKNFANRSTNLGIHSSRGPQS